MYVISHNVLKKRHGIEDERGAVQVSGRLDTNAVATAFCGGDKPNLVISPSSVCRW